jgi:hypothetical protein
VIARLKHSVYQGKNKRRRGVSPVLATVIIFGLIITGVMVTFIQVIPYIEQAQSEQVISTVSNNLKNLDATIKTLITESGNPGGIRSIYFSKPAGKLSYISDYSYISLYLEDQGESLLDSIIDSQEFGALDWIYDSPRAVLPRGTSQYLTGPDPFTAREPGFITGIFSSTDNHDITNLTLSHQDDRKHHITLNYRISVYLTISTQPTPEIRFQVFLMSLSANFDDIHSQYKQMTVHVSQNVSVPYLVPVEPSVTAIDLNLDHIDSTGTTTTPLWSTDSISGLSQISYFNIVVQILRYEINLEI